MKTQNTTFFQALDAEQLDNLVKEVKETIAADISRINDKPVFSAADLWNLQRMRRIRITRRHLV
ncbi:MAG: hypothetical protein NVSMB63_05350 [Sediminibacterium sp.]